MGDTRVPQPGTKSDFSISCARKILSCIPDEKIQVNPRLRSGSDHDVLTLCLTLVVMDVT